MIKFFRKIRQKLLAEGKIGTYLKYAIGEIMLVVIGILIALSVNNWNDKRKNNLTESEYYCKLLADFELDKKNIAKIYKESERKIEVGKKTLLDLHGTQKDKAYLINKYIQAYRTNAFVPSKATITDILATGKLNLLTNDSLKNKVIQYYAELDNYLYQLELNRTNNLQKAFEFDSWLEVGFQYAQYAQEALGPEILTTLPVNDWHLDPNSKYFRQFQDDFVFFITMSEREKQFFNAILKEMEPIYQQLQVECRDK
jgi:hypothetical protein